MKANPGEWLDDQLKKIGISLPPFTVGLVVGVVLTLGVTLVL